MSKIKNEFKINKKQIIIICVFVVLIVAISYYFLNNTNENNSIQYGLYKDSSQDRIYTPEEHERLLKRIPEYRRYIRIKVQNTKTQEQMEIICLLSEWKNICMNRLKLVEDESLYDEYMHKNSGKVFDVDDTLYSEVEKFQSDRFYKNVSKEYNRPR